MAAHAVVIRSVVGTVRKSMLGVLKSRANTSMSDFQVESTLRNDIYQPSDLHDVADGQQVSQ